QSVEREGADALHDAAAAFEAAGEVADEDGLARGELRLLHRLRRHPVHFIDDDLRHLGGRLVLRLRGGAEGADFAAKIEAAAGAVAEAALDADLFVEARGVRSE